MSRRFLALVAASALVVGLLSASPSYAAVATTVSGWSTSAATMKLGGELSASVTVKPAAVRTVLLQARKGTTGSVSTRATLTTTAAGAVTARFVPPSTGTWYIRLSVRATATYAAVTTAWRKVTVSGAAGATTVTTPTVSPSSVLTPAKQTITATVKPAGVRAVEVWAKAPGATTFVLRGRTTSSSTGAASLTWSAPAVGTWTYRVYVRPSLTLKGVTSATRTATVTALPAQVTGLVATSGPESVLLSWTNPTAYLAKVVVRRSDPGGTAPQKPTDGFAVPLASDTATSATATGLPFNGGLSGQYAFSVFTLDAAGRYGPPATVSQGPGEAPPGPVTNVAADTGVLPTKVVLTWTNPVDHFGWVSVRRTLVSEPTPSSVFEGVDVLSFSTATTLTDVGLTPGTAYRWTFFTLTPNGLPGPAVSIEASTLSPALTWGGAQKVYQPAGSLTAIDCPPGVALFCVAADRFGNVLELSGGTWTAPAQVPGVADPILAVSCRSQSVCYGSTQAGDIVVRSSLGVWSKQTHLSDASVFALSCAPGGTFCVAVDSGGAVRFTEDGVAWKGTTVLPGSAPGRAVDCLSATFCMITSTNGRTYTLTGVSGTTVSLSTNTVVMGAGSADVAAVDCPSTTKCLFVTRNGKVWKTGDPSVTDLDPGRAIMDVSCASEFFCIAVDYSGRSMTFTGVTWSSPAAIDGRAQWVSVSCPSSTSCVAVDAGSFGWESRFDGTSWSVVNPVDIDNSASHLSCTSTTFCMAVDNAGRATTYNGSSWTAPAQIGTDQYGISAVDCSSPSLCVAGTTIGDLYRWNGTTWTLDSIALGGQVVRGVSCPTSTSCTVVATGGRAMRWDGVTWTSPVTAGAGNAFLDVSCPLTDWCMGVTTGSTYSMFTGGLWSPSLDVFGAADATNAIVSVECSSPLFCAGISQSGNVLWWSGGAWSPPETSTATTPIATILSCATATTCTAVSQSFVLRSVTWDGDAWADSAPVDLGGLTPAGTVVDVSCVSNRWCMAIDTTGRVHLGTR